LKDIHGIEPSAGGRVMMLDPPSVSAAEPGPKTELMSCSIASATTKISVIRFFVSNRLA